MTLDEAIITALAIIYFGILNASFDRMRGTQNA